MGGQLAGISILLVDDDPDARDLLDFALAEAGAAVTTVATAAEALVLVKTSLPSIVVTDVAMPALDGVWLCQQIRALPGKRHVPVIAVTALVFPRELARIEAAGFDATVLKPYLIDELQTVIERLAFRR